MYTQHLYAKLNKNVVFQSFSIKPNAIYMDNQSIITYKSAFDAINFTAPPDELPLNEVEDAL